MTDRDTFAAAALTGLLAGSEHTCDVDGADHAETAYYIADAMLRQRGKEVWDNCVAGNNPKMECPVTEPLPKEKRAEVSFTDEERAAIETAVMEAEAHQHESRAVTLRNLLERMK